jgi:uncharacterized protein YndB with AHSA1/START domain
MNEYGELLDESTVRFERLLPGPIERVWSYLTESDKRARWLCGGDVESTVGGRVDMHFHNMSLSSDEDIPRPEKYRDMPEKMSFAGKVTRCEPPYVLAHTWEFGEESSEVCYESASAAAGTHTLMCWSMFSAATSHARSTRCRCSMSPTMARGLVWELFDRDRLRKIPRLINVRAPEDRNVIGE